MQTSKMYLALLTILALCSIAIADVYPVGEPREIGSWEQRFNIDNATSFDFVTMMAEGDTRFKSSSLNDFSIADWQLVYENGASSTDHTIASAEGQPTTALEFDVYLQVPQSPNQAGAFQVALFSGYDLLCAYHMERFPRLESTPGYWMITASDWQPVRDDVVGSVLPVPGAAALGLMGLGIVGVWIRKRML